MKRLALTLALLCAATAAFAGGIRPPSTPLVTVDPYFSVWSQADEAHADVTRHWTGWKQPLLSAVRVDGKTYRMLGSETFTPMGHDTYDKDKKTREDVSVDKWYYRQSPSPAFSQAASQTDRTVSPTNTVYTFSCGGVDIEMKFTAPLLLDDVDLLARPVNYLTWTAKSSDGRKHDVAIYFEASPRLAIDVNVQPVIALSGKRDAVQYARVGTVAQPVLEKRGDDIRIDWGYFYLAATSGKTLVVNGAQARKAFSAKADIQSLGSEVTSENFEQDGLALAWSGELGKVGKDPVTRHILLAYDDIRSIRYLKKDELRPYWNRSGTNSIEAEICRAEAGYSDIIERCENFDRQLLDEALASGGQEYADLCALAYRQTVSAHKLVQSPKGELFFFSKENFSNGCCGTVDVTYPSMPLFLLYNTDIAKALVNFIFDYAEGPLWGTRTWAPHDIGRYPDAYGQHYGNWMPLEESGNMLLLTAAIVKVSGDTEYARKHWTILTKWALYCAEHGQRPENTLCTDDFAGKLAHNVNLSAKSILGVAAYAQMARALGKADEANAFEAYARSMAAIWKKEAFEEDHYRLAFDNEGSWSQKYNLVWDKVLDLRIFDKDIMQTEMSWYLAHQNTYGLPLDSRKQYTKTDWILWTATMAPDDETFRALVSPVWKFYNETPDRVPLCDWVNTDEPTKNNMIARSVVGGFFMKMLSDRLN